MSQDQDQEQGLRILDNALWRIARRGDCDYYDDEKSRPKPCDCPRCVAIAALEAAKNWRFHGAHYERTKSPSFPREIKMQAAWMKLASENRDPDTLLASILKEDRMPSARDWYVATSVVQWLATNVGMTVLQAAGFKYQQWDQDEADGPLFQRRLEREYDTQRDRAAKAKAPPAEHGTVPFLSDNQRYSLRCIRDFARARLTSAPADDQNRCDPGLSWLDDLLDGTEARRTEKP